VKSIKSCGITSGEVSCFQLDVGSFKSIKTFAELVQKRFPRIDLLINNGMYVLFISLLFTPSKICSLRDCYCFVLYARLT
jgi:NAD(P)-dependent dehydrogenase (short-subunit alcohol dehydrogenase family)